MSPEISERSLEEAIECGLLQHGPDMPAEASAEAGACIGDVTAVRETPPGGYRKRSPEDYHRMPAADSSKPHSTKLWHCRE